MELKTLMYILFSVVLIGLGVLILIEAVRRGGKLDSAATRPAYKLKPPLNVIAAFTFIGCGAGLTRLMGAENAQLIILMLAMVWWLDQRSTKKDWDGQAQPTHSKLPEAQKAEAKENWTRAIADTMPDDDAAKESIDRAIDEMMKRQGPL